MSIKVTPLTSGPVTPGIEVLGKPYRWNRTEGWRPDDPRIGRESRDASKARPHSGKASVNAKASRIAAYTAARDEGLDDAAAAAKVGVVSPKTRRKYESEYQAAKEAAS